MKYGTLPRAMWHIFAPSFVRKMPLLTQWNAQKIMHWAKQEYRVILTRLPDFDKGDRFRINIFSAAMLAAVCLHLPIRPNVEQLSRFYREAMTGNPIMHLFCKANKRYTRRAQARLARQAEASQSCTNPYSWRFSYEAGADLEHYTAVFTTCGILHLFTDLGLKDLVPALCALDYDMAAIGDSDFSRRFTLASGGSCCDCHYAKRKGER